ncbi:MAG: glycosyltransferase [Alphaproteobacteria bacterium]|nr:glycosyltransferase [Alphaproteobacteria bacterium]
MILAYICAGWCAVILILNYTSVALMSRKCRARARNLPPPENAPPVSIVRPLRGLEPFSEETLGATFDLDYPDYEIVFCVQSPNDPIIALVERLIAAHPEREARLLVGDDYVSVNPKLNNCVKGWDAARYDYVILADSNALPPRDYIQTMLAAFRDTTAMSVSMPIGSRPKGFWAMVECAILNTFQARWQYGAEAIGAGFAQGKNMMWRRDVLDRAGGIRALASEVAEDAASTKVIRAQGMDVRLVDMPFEQPLGKRTAREVYSRHVRWARLRRATFPAHYVPEFINGSFAALVLGAYAAVQLDGGISTVALITALIVLSMHGGEIWLARVCGFPLDWRMPFALVVRDLMLPVMYIDALIYDDFVWHGAAMTVREAEETTG